VNDGHSPLTIRQQQVLVAIAHGLENKQIAAQLGISVETVRQHVRNMLRSLYARNRAHAVALAAQHGLFDGMRFHPHDRKQAR
jgi:DNA-binding NarL/FixJ family response regulator